MTVGDLIAQLTLLEVSDDTEVKVFVAEETTWCSVTDVRVVTRPKTFVVLE